MVYLHWYLSPLSYLWQRLSEIHMRDATIDIPLYLGRLVKLSVYTCFTSYWKHFDHLSLCIQFFIMILWYWIKHKAWSTNLSLCLANFHMFSHETEREFFPADQTLFFISVMDHFVLFLEGNIALHWSDVNPTSAQTLQFIRRAPTHLHHSSWVRRFSFVRSISNPPRSLSLGNGLWKKIKVMLRK